MVVASYLSKRRAKSTSVVKVECGQGRILQTPVRRWFVAQQRVGRAKGACWVGRWWGNRGERVSFAFGWGKYRSTGELAFPEGHTCMCLSVSCLSCHACFRLIANVSEFLPSDKGGRSRIRRIAHQVRYVACVAWWRFLNTDWAVQREIKRDQARRPPQSSLNFTGQFRRGRDCPAVVIKPAKKIDVR